MNQKTAPFVENISEATTACLITMVQGNLLAITLSHWLIATQTGIAAGTLTAALFAILKSQKRWVISLGLGVITSVVDFLVHPSMFGSIVTEAIVTGIGAAILSSIVGRTIAAVQAARRRAARPVQ